MPYANGTPIKVDRKKPVFLDELRDMGPPIAIPRPLETNISPLSDYKLGEAKEVTKHNKAMFTLLKQLFAERSTPTRQIDGMPPTPRGTRQRTMDK
jgi:hypothetical protein